MNMWLGKATLDAYVSVSMSGALGLRTDRELISQRIGTGAFEYDFGALDDADNPLTNSYMNLMYDANFRRRRSKVPLTLPSSPFSFTSFGNPSRSLLLIMSIMGWFPGLITWMFNNSNDPGMQKLRRNKDEAHRVARKLLDSKRQELKDGTPRKDILSLLGLSLSFCLFWIHGC